jgi:hypothetical protein
VLVRVTPSKVDLPVKVMDCGPVDDPDAWEDARFVCWAVNQYQRKRGEQDVLACLCELIALCEEQAKQIHRDEYDWHKARGYDPPKKVAPPELKRAKELVKQSPESMTP